MKVCLIDGCEKPVKARGWCPMHYWRWSKKGDPLWTPPEKPESCSIEECPKPVVSRGWCTTHYDRWLTHGDPLGGGPFRESTKGKTCKADGCDRPVVSKGLCSRHYSRLIDNGDLIPRRLRNVTKEERFWFYVEPGPEDECWEWSGPRYRAGYGVIYSGQTQQKAHRFSYELHHGPIPAGQIVRHTCDNPPCCNPHHLLTGTHADNVADMMARGRHSSQRRKS